MTLSKRNLVQYQCSRCYKTFERADGVEETECPYCKPMVYDQASHADIIEGVDDRVHQVIQDIVDYAWNRLDSLKDELHDEIRSALMGHKKE